MNIKQGSTVKVTATYTSISGAIGTVVRVPDVPDELHLVRLTNGTEVWLFPEEFEPYSPPVNRIREKIETKIEEYRETVPTGKLTHDTEVAGIITGLRLALDILDEEE